MDLIDKILPAQQTGSKTGATAKYTMASRPDAVSLFMKASTRLMQINKWYEFCGNKGAEFQLTDASGALSDGAPKVGDLIRIRLPAPPHPNGDGFDWVRIEKIEVARQEFSDEEICGLRVRPIRNPEANSGVTAHFYTSEATSSFIVYRKARTVWVMERGRNELPNTSGSFLNKVRNMLIAIPAMLGFSTPQWKCLVKGILNAPD